MSDLLIMIFDRYLSLPDYQRVPVTEVYREGMVAYEVPEGRAGSHFSIICHNVNYVNGYKISMIQLSSYLMIELCPIY